MQVRLIVPGAQWALWIPRWLFWLLCSLCSLRNSHCTAPGSCLSRSPTFSFMNLFIYTYSLSFLKFSSSPPTHWINFPQLGSCPLDVSNSLFVNRLWGSCFCQTARSNFIAAVSPPSCLKTETCRFLEFPMPCCYFISWKDICSGLLGFLLLFCFFVMSHYSLSAYPYRRRFLFSPIFFGVMASVTKQTFQAQTNGHGES